MSLCRVVLVVYSCCLLLSVLPVSEGMLVKDWGTGVQMSRLAFAMRDLFQDSFQFLTSGLPPALLGGTGGGLLYPAQDLAVNFTQEWRGSRGEGLFLGYNGWLEGLRLETDGLKDRGQLRRMIVTGAERSMDLKEHSEVEHKHEIITCDSCMLLRINKVHYAYESLFADYETSGLLETGSVNITISFQLSLSSDWNETTGQVLCRTALEPLLLLPDPPPAAATPRGNSSQFPDVRLTNVGLFTFLSEHIDLWILQHFNAVVLRSIQIKFDQSLRRMLQIGNPCEKLLTS